VNQVRTADLVQYNQIYINGFQAEPSRHGLEGFHITKEINEVNLRIEKGNNSKRKI
jgi:hypothetical protein